MHPTMEIGANFSTSSAYVVLLGNKQLLHRLFSQCDPPLIKMGKQWFDSMKYQVVQKVQSGGTSQMTVSESTFAASRRYKQPRTAPPTLREGLSLVIRRPSYGMRADSQNNHDRSRAAINKSALHTHTH